MNAGTMPITSLAVVVHVFYTDIFAEIIQELQGFNKLPISLYITTPEHLMEEVRSLIPPSFKEATILATPNHGRDILPFLKIFPRITEDRHTILLKLHTKKSNHLHRKSHWRTAIFKELIGPGKMDQALATFRKDPAIGLIAPSNNILSMQLHYGANGAKLHSLAQKLGLSDQQLHGLHFIAGSMFYASTKALEPIICLNLTDDDFEPETGQVDGTMAHALERAFTLSLIKSNLKLTDTDYHSDFSGYKVTKNHRYTC